MQIYKAISESAVPYLKEHQQMLKRKKQKWQEVMHFLCDMLEIL